MFVVFGLTRISLFVVFGLTQIPRISLIFLWVLNLSELFGGRVEVVFGLTQIPRISLNCIDDVKSHRIVWWESEWGVYLFVWGLCVLIFLFLILIFYD